MGAHHVSSELKSVAHHFSKTLLTMSARLTLMTLISANFLFIIILNG
jgi:hypothetical protein